MPQGRAAHFEAAIPSNAVPFLVVRPNSSTHGRSPRYGPSPPTSPRSLGVRLTAHQVLAARHRLPAVVSTSCSPFARTTTTMPCFWKHRAAVVYPPCVEPVWPNAPEEAPYSDRRSQIPNPYSRRLPKSVISSSDAGDTTCPAHSAWNQRASVSESDAMPPSELNAVAK